MKGKTVSLLTIRLHDRNPRTIKPEALQRLCESIERDPLFMELRPIVVDEEGVIIGGNQRYRACTHMGMKEVLSSWVKVAVGLTEDQRKRFILIDNSPQGLTGEWDKDILFEDFQIPELSDLGLDKLFKDMNKASADGEEVEVPFQKVEALAGSSLLEMKNDVRFDGGGLWEIPNLRADRIIDATDAPRLFLPSAPIDEGAIMWNYGSDSTKGLDWSRTVVSFYVDDARFECFWNDTAGHIAPFVNRKIVGMLCPNYSCYDTFPAAMRMWNVFRSRWVGRYAQEAGINIMPDISGQPEDVHWLFDGIPKGVPFAFQCHRENVQGAERKNIILREAIRVINPPVIWCYGQLAKAKWYPALEHADCRWITPRNERKRQEKEYK